MPPCRAKTHFFKELDLRTVLQPPVGTGKCGTQIICTIGPGCRSVETLCALLRAGMSVARIDLTWGPLDYHIRSLDNLRLATQKTQRLCGLMVDTLGREVMVCRPFTRGPDGWPQHETPFQVAGGDTVILTTTRADGVGIDTELDPSRHPAEVCHNGARSKAGHPQGTSQPDTATTPDTPFFSRSPNGTASAGTSNDTMGQAPVSLSPWDAANSPGSNGAVNGAVDGSLGAMGSGEAAAPRDGGAASGVGQGQAFGGWGQQGFGGWGGQGKEGEGRATGVRVLIVSYPRFHDMVQVGDLIYVGRYLACGAAGSGSLYLRVVATAGRDVTCRAENDASLGGLLTVYHAERSGGGLTNLQNDLPLFSPYDRHCLRTLVARHDVDFVAMSYTRTAEDVEAAREFVTGELGLPDTRLIAKIESRQALFNAEAILARCEGVVISRGNLGLDCPPEKMAMVQKSLVQACNLMGRSCVLTRVVDTMVDAPRPTRAEATDIANAVLDNVDAILLGAETLRGKYPVETVQTLVRICREAEAVFDHERHYEHLMSAAAEVVSQQHAAVATAASLTLQPHLHAPPTPNPFATAPSEQPPPPSQQPLWPPPTVFDVRAPGAGLPVAGAWGGPEDVGRLLSMTARAKVPLGPVRVPVHPAFKAAGGAGGARGAAAAPQGPEDEQGDEGGSDAGPPSAGRSQGIYPPTVKDTSRDQYPPPPPLKLPSAPSYPYDANPFAGPCGPPAALPHNPAAPYYPPTYPASPPSSPPYPRSSSSSTLPHTPSPTWLHAPPAHPPFTPAPPRPLSFAATSRPGAAPLAPPSPEHLKLEAIASAAVNTADTIQARLIVVYTHTGYTAQLVAKYRPSIPITTIVVPRLVSDGLHWRLSGRQSARQCLLTRGVSPTLARSHNEEEMLEEIVYQAGGAGVVGPGDSVVLLQKVHDDYCVKVVEVDRAGRGVRGSGVRGGGERLAAMPQGVRAVARTLSEVSNVIPRAGVGARAGAGAGAALLAGAGEWSSGGFAGLGGGGRALAHTLSVVDEGMVEDLVQGLGVL